MSRPFPDIATLQQQFRDGTINPLAVVETCLAQIHHAEPAIQAWVSVDADGARRNANAIGEKFRQGLPQGPLAGIPLGIKDIIDIAGLPTRAGSRLRAAHLAASDAALVTRLRAADAILLGKTVTTEWACFDPPPTRNPWNLEHTPGGSSSGSAAAVASGMCVAAIGSQTGGSIVRPAAYCGVAGFKPSLGRISTQGVVPISSHLDHPGPIAAYAADLQVLFQILAGEAPRVSNRERTVVFAGWFQAQSSVAVWAAFEQALARIDEAGWKAVEAPLPASFAEVHTMHLRLMAFDLARDHLETWRATPELYGPKVAGLIEEGSRVSPDAYEQARRYQVRFRTEMNAILSLGTIALMPSTPTTAPDRSTTGTPLFNSPWSFAGLPSATIPCGIDSQGLPCGLQLVGASGADELVLASAAAAEMAIGFRRRPPEPT